MRHGKQLKTIPFPVFEYDVQCTCCMGAIAMYVCALGAVCFGVAWMVGGRNRSNRPKYIRGWGVGVRVININLLHVSHVSLRMILK